MTFTCNYDLRNWGTWYDPYGAPYPFFHIYSGAIVNESNVAGNPSAMVTTSYGENRLKIDTRAIKSSSISHHGGGGNSTATADIFGSFVISESRDYYFDYRLAANPPDFPNRSSTTYMNLMITKPDGGHLVNIVGDHNTDIESSSTVFLAAGTYTFASTLRPDETTFGVFDGYGRNDSMFSITAVPEPGTLTALGVAALVVLKRRRK